MWRIIISLASIITLMSVVLRACATGEGLMSGAKLPLDFQLDKAGFVTLVIDDAAGNRVRNLISDQYFPAGKHTVEWDGLSDPTESQVKGVLAQTRGSVVSPGLYKLRGLVHGPLHAKYQFAVDNHGSPPWLTSNGRGGWLSDHFAPSAVLYVPASLTPENKPEMLICSRTAEDGSSLVWTDLDGNKLYGKRVFDSSTVGATDLSLDRSPARKTDTHYYAAVAWRAPQNQQQAELRLFSIDEKRHDRMIFRCPLETTNFVQNGNNKQADAKTAGLAVWDRKAFVSVPDENHVLVVDLSRDSGKLIARIPVTSPHGLSFDDGGRLYILSGTELIQVTNPQLSSGATFDITKHIPLEGVLKPEGLQIDHDNNIYVSDNGGSNQVKQYSLSGNLVRAFGHPGPLGIGPYDSEHMNAPRGFAVIPDRSLWVAEHDYLPKRISIWSAGGKFLRALYGPPRYGGGGSIDPANPSRLYYSYRQRGGMEFHLDWDKGDARLVNVYARTPTGMDPDFVMSFPETPLYVGGRQYLTNCFVDHPTDGTKVVGVWRLVDGKLKRLAIIGWIARSDLIQNSAEGKRYLQLDRSKRNEGGQDTIFSWSDANEDGKIQSSEIEFRPMPMHVAGITLDADLSAVMQFRNSSDSYTVCVPARVNADGAKVKFDLNDTSVARTTGDTVIGPGQALATPDRWLVVTGGPMRGYKDGRSLWSYPDPFPNLAASHVAPKPSHSGELIGPTRILGPSFRTQKGDAGYIWAVNGNRGNVYFFTTDGLFLSTLFKDVRLAPSWTSLAVAQRGMDVSAISNGEEAFYVTQYPVPNSDTLYLVAGHSSSSIIEVTGLGDVRRLPIRDVTVSALFADSVTKSFAASSNDTPLFLNPEQSPMQRGGRDKLMVEVGASVPAMDARLSGWTNRHWVRIDENTFVSAIVAQGDLYVAYRTNDPALLQNSGKAWQRLFKSGGALDLMIGTDMRKAGRSQPVVGDQRLLVTRVDGKPKAVLYKAVSPSGSAANAVLFSSPDRSVKFDEVKDVTSSVRLVQNGADYEIQVPLSLLGIQPKIGSEILGDFGVLRGRNGETVERDYWNNKNTGNVSDIPDESQLTPDKWGVLKFIDRRLQ